MPLTNSQVRYLRGLGHALQPVLSIGQKGITEALLNEANITLEHHELIKVKIQGAEREERTAIIEELKQQTGAELIQTIGRVALLYRPAAEPKLVLPR